MSYTYFRLLWPCIMNVGWRERNQQDATNLAFIIKLLSQHVSGIIMPIIRRTRACTAAYGVLHWLCWLWLCGIGTQTCVPAPHNHSHHYQCRTPYAAVHTLVLLMMGLMMPETCWDKSLIINNRLVASCWFLSLCPELYIIYTQNTSNFFRELLAYRYPGAKFVDEAEQTDQLHNFFVVIFLRFMKIRYRIL